MFVDRCFGTECCMISINGSQKPSPKAVLTVEGSSLAFDDKTMAEWAAADALKDVAYNTQNIMRTVAYSYCLVGKSFCCGHL